MPTTLRTNIVNQTATQPNTLLNAEPAQDQFKDRIKIMQKTIRNHLSWIANHPLHRLGTPEQKEFLHHEYNRFRAGVAILNYKPTSLDNQKLKSICRQKFPESYSFQDTMTILVFHALFPTLNKTRV